MLNSFRDFLKLETASGILLVLAAVIAMIVVIVVSVCFIGSSLFGRSWWIGWTVW